MITVLNHLGVTHSILGNHDLDFGEENMVKMGKASSFPWLLSNVISKRTQRPLGECASSLLFDWEGVKVGMLGLVERDWMCALGSVEEDSIEFEEYVDACKRIAPELRRQGAQIVIAMTHMRMPNDLSLAKLCGGLDVGDSGIDLILGGHDHHYEVDDVNGVLVAKAGAEFRYITEIVLDFSKPTPADPATNRRAFPFTVTHHQHAVDRSVAPDPEMASIVEEMSFASQASLLRVIGTIGSDLDCITTHVRTRETTVGNLVCDIALNTLHADVCMLNSGSFRSDTVHAAGEFTLGDLVKLFPFATAPLRIRVTGAILLAGLENSVSKYPAYDGRFCQVAGIKFTFDASKPPHSRVLLDSVLVKGEPLCLTRSYIAVVSNFMRKGKEDYHMFVPGPTNPGCEDMQDTDSTVSLGNLLRNHFRILAVLNGIESSSRVFMSHFSNKQLEPSSHRRFVRLPAADADGLHRATSDPTAHPHLEPAPKLLARAQSEGSHGPARLSRCISAEVLASFPLPKPQSLHIKLTQLQTLSPKHRFRSAVRAVIRSQRAAKLGGGSVTMNPFSENEVLVPFPIIEDRICILNGLPVEEAPAPAAAPAPEPTSATATAPVAGGGAGGGGEGAAAAGAVDAAGADATSAKKRPREE